MSHTLLRSFEGKEDLADATGFSADGRTVVLARHNHNMIVRDVDTGNLKQMVTVPTAVIALALDPEERDIVMACSDGKIRRYNLRKKEWDSDLGTIDPKSVLSIQAYTRLVVVTTRLGIVVSGDDIRSRKLFNDGSPTLQGLVAAAPNKGLIVFQAGKSLDAASFDFMGFTI